MDRKNISFKKLLNSIFLATCPFFACLLRLLIDHKSFADVTLLTSSWNDEFFYFKQVSSCVNSFFPIGFFGYNESQAAFLSFGAWNPAIVMPYIIWSKIFGWGLYSTIICHIVMTSVALFIFSLLSNINFKKSITLFVVLLCFFPFSRYLLSSMTDMVIVSFIIILLGLYFRCISKNTKLSLVLMYFLVLILTLMRPYLVMLILLPAYHTIRKNKKSFPIPVAAFLATFLAFYFTNKYMTAEYIGDVYSIDWIRYFLNEGIAVGVRETLNLLRTQWTLLWYMLFHNLPGGVAFCTYFRFFFIFVIILIFELVVACVKKNWHNLFLMASLLVAHFAILMAILLMYNLHDGSKHLLLFIIMDIVVLTYCGINEYVEGGLVAMFSIYSFWYMSSFTTEFNINYKNDFSDRIYAFESSVADLEYVPSLSWDNDIIIVYRDNNNDLGTENKEICWQYTYVLPDAFAMNYCENYYVIENWHNLKSKYILVETGGDVDNYAIKQSAKCIAGNQDVKLYQLR